MFTLLRLAAAFAAQNAADKARLTARLAGLYALAIGLGLIALGFGLAAAWAGLAHRYTPITASLILAGIFLVLALIVVGVARYKARARRSGLDLSGLAQVQNRTAAGVADGVAAAREGFAKAPAVPLMGAFIVGLVIAMRLRR